MKLLKALHDYLEQYSHRFLLNEALCTCGDANHVRLFFFRVDNQPVTVVASEATELTTEQFREASRCLRVEPLTEKEFDAIYADTELGHPQPFENPFRTAVYFDESLMLFKDLVFCPRMFAGRPGECFRVPTRDLLDRTHATVLPLAAPVPCDDWAV